MAPRVGARAGHGSVTQIEVCLGHSTLCGESAQGTCVPDLFRVGESCLWDGIMRVLSRAMLRIHIGTWNGGTGHAPLASREGCSALSFHSMRGKGTQWTYIALGLLDGGVMPQGWAGVCGVEPAGSQ